MLNTKDTSANVKSDELESEPQQEVVTVQTDRSTIWHCLGMFRCVQERYLLTVMMFFGLFLAYALRVGMSIALVAMVNQTALSINTSSGSECVSDISKHENTTFIIQEGEFIWDEKIQGIILSSFFYGYIIMQFPGGHLAQVFGAKWVFGFGVLGTALMTLLVPLAASWSPYAVVVVRTLAGLTEGVTYPSFYVLISIWYPVQEQNTHFGLVGSGSMIGTIVTLPFSAWLCQRTLLGGWPLVFYVSGGISCLWFLFWCVIVSSTPEEHPRISNAELSYILSGRKTITRRQQMKSLPLLKIITCKAIWALAIVKFSTSWLFYVMLTDLPIYLNTILHFPLDENGLLNSLVFAAQALTGIFSGMIADRLRVRPGVSLTVLRKIFQLIGSCGSSLCLMFVTYLGCDWVSSYVLLLFTSALIALSVGGADPMNMDIAPNHAGVVGGLTNGFSNMAGIFGPMVTGFITENNNTLSAWSRVFIISGCMGFGGITVFLFYGTARAQEFSTEIQHVQLEADGDIDISSPEEHREISDTAS